MEQKKTIKIATRSSALALWQANEVKQKLNLLGFKCELILVESSGDLQLTQPLYAMGISGIFTKQLDLALLNKQADIAVHSLKDVPTKLAEGLTWVTALPRGASEDVIILKNKAILNEKMGNATIATSSLRRKAQWLMNYPNHKVVPIRGNVQTRLKKFYESNELDGVIFAKAGLERLDLLNENTHTLTWMISAPAQGIVGVVCNQDDTEMIQICQKINDEGAFKAGYIERQFLQELMGGCSVPISAIVDILDEKIFIKAAMHSFDGKQEFLVNEVFPLANWQKVGSKTAQLLLNLPGANELLNQIRTKDWSNESTID